MAAQREPLQGAPQPAPGPSGSSQAPVSHALGECTSSCASSRVPSVEAPDATSCGPVEPQGHSAAPAAALIVPCCVPDEAGLCSAGLIAAAPEGGCGAAAGEPLSDSGAQDAAACAAPGQPRPWGVPEGGCSAAAGDAVSGEQEAAASAAPGELQTPRAAGEAGSLSGGMWLPTDVCGADGLVETEVQVCYECI